MKFPALTLQTLAGLAAIALWSTTMGGSRLVGEHLGVFSVGAVVSLLAGVVGSVLFYRDRRDLRQLLANRRYVIGCGSLFTIYIVCIYGAIGLASGRQQVLEVSIINYLWPAMTLVLSVFLFSLRARWTLALGLVIAFGGVLAALMPPGAYDMAATIENVRSNFIAYLLAMMAAVGWAVYSNMVRLLAGNTKVTAVPLFFLAGGLCMAALAISRGEQQHWSPQVFFGIVFLAAGPSLGAYSLWDLAMQRGDMTLVVSASQLTPVLSTLVSCVLFGRSGGLSLWLGCAMVVAGAVICKHSVGRASSAISTSSGDD